MFVGDGLPDAADGLTDLQRLWGESDARGMRIAIRLRPGTDPHDTVDLLITARELLVLHLDNGCAAGVERPADELRELADGHPSRRRTAIG